MTKKSQKKYNIAVVGATGNVGKNILSILDERNFPINNIYALASPHSIGKEIGFRDNKNIVVDSLYNFDFSNAEIAIFAAGSKVAKEFVTQAAKSGCIVIDNSSYFRMHKDVPLVVPEVNGEKIGTFDNLNIIANPNCVAAPLVMALKPIHNLFAIKRVVISTYQSVSGSGKKAMDELYDQTKGIFVYQKKKPEHFSRQIAFNVIPQIDEIDENGFTKEENKIIEETKKILNDSNIEVTATSVRVPVFIGHSISVNIEFHDNIAIEDILNSLTNAKGLIVSDYEDNTKYITPVEISGKDAVYISRIRRDNSLPNGISMWISSDNMRKGAALNAVQIAEILVTEYL